MLKARGGLNETHLSPTDYSPYDPLDVVFASNSSCVLSPEVTEGPYYVAGEYIRNNVIDGQEGVPLVLDLQVINIANCEPLSGVMVEIWRGFQTFDIKLRVY
jgi:protocatechuate 3,4-dioxygenase beta subunit